MLCDKLRQDCVNSPFVLRFSINGISGNGRPPCLLCVSLCSCQLRWWRGLWVWPVAVLPCWLCAFWLPSVSEDFLAFWQNKLFQAHLVISLGRCLASVISPRSLGSLKIVIRNQDLVAWCALCCSSVTVLGFLTGQNYGVSMYMYMSIHICISGSVSVYVS